MHESSLLLEPLAKLIHQPAALVLVALLLIAALIDWLTYRIPNWLTAGGMLFGLVYNTLTVQPWQDGLLGSVSGLGVGIAVLLPVYLLRVMGAGDVKLMGMVGAIVGLPDIVLAVLYSLIVGGIAAVAFALYHKAARRMTANVMDIVQSMVFAVAVGTRPTPALAGRASIGKLPYGVSIAGGTIAWLIARLFGLA